MAVIDIDLGTRVGLVGDAHGNLPFLIEALFSLKESEVSSVVQLGDFGLIWSGASYEQEAIDALNVVLEAMDLFLYVVLGNHENYDLVDSLEAGSDGARRLGRVILLPRSGRLTVAGRPAGFLAGAASIDRIYRQPWVSWWPQEVPTDEEAQGLAAQGAGSLDVVFAHDALRTPGLQSRLSANRGLWHEEDLRYAESSADLFTERALGELADGGLVISGHYHLRHSAEERLLRPDGTPIRARTEVLSFEWDDGAVGVLEAHSLSVKTWRLDPESARVNYNALRAKPQHWVR